MAINQFMLSQNAGLNVGLVKEYLVLCKPKVVLMIVFTAFVGMFLATPERLAPSNALFSMVGVSLYFASAAAINYVLDQRFDKLMARTHKRPPPQGKIPSIKAIGLTVALAFIVLSILLKEAGTLTALLTGISLIGYAVFQTISLKHETSYNIVWGAAAGAMPPILGWAAQTGVISFESILLFIIIFLSTPPHFWALAIRRRE